MQAVYTSRRINNIFKWANFLGLFHGGNDGQHNCVVLVQICKTFEIQDDFLWRHGFHPRCQFHKRLCAQTINTNLSSSRNWHTRNEMIGNDHHCSSCAPGILWLKTECAPSSEVRNGLPKNGNAAKSEILNENELKSTWVGDKWRTFAWSCKYQMIKTCS